MSRKLQAEIERVFKKVAEGIEEFEDCHDKVVNASSASQKEKYETDLKKEIKKLQRLRDQIKTWLQSNEIKDKQDLLHHRKLIEKQMEKFKAIEKEMKTKAYSKEGLQLSMRLDPKEKEKQDLCNWLADSVDSLTTQIDVLEATAEQIEGNMGKKRRDAGKLEQLGSIHERVERHKHHIKCLERIQRLLENESLSTEQVQAIQEDVDYYVTENEDVDFVEDEYIYDDLPLDDDDGLFTIPGEDDTFGHDQGDDDEDSLSHRDSVSSHNVSHSHQSSIHAAVPSEPEPVPSTALRSALGSKSNSTTRLMSAVVPQPSTLPPAPVESKNAWTEVKESVLSPTKPPSAATTSLPPPPPASSLAQPWAAIASQNIVTTATTTAGVQAVLAASNSSVPAASSTASSIVSPADQKTPAATSNAGSSSAVTTDPVGKKAAAAHEATAASQSKPPAASATAKQTGKKAAAPPSTASAPAVGAPSVSAAVNTSGPVTPVADDSRTTAAVGSEKLTNGQQPPVAAARSGASPVGTKGAAQSGEQPSRAATGSAPAMPRPKCFTLFQDSHVPDAFAELMATFLKAKDQFSARQNAAGYYALQRQMVDQSLHGIPGLLDQERPKTHSRPQASTPAYYPQTALPVMEHPGMASRLDLDTLFFAFYYLPNTYQQYLAAKELKRQSWRFHKKYYTWFQRYEEPSDITDDYEQGTYIYFDYEGSWCQRKKSEFRFEYRFLEDAELV
ncbi:general negative regulator of transcription subunit 5 [Linderina pennispora]|nr:general negative regulator of transcription subunit 5 [Linderina pennispora]